MKKDNKGKKMNRRMANKAEYRADKRFSGALKILALISRGAPVVTGPRGVMALQGKYGI